MENQVEKERVSRAEESWLDFVDSDGVIHHEVLSDFPMFISSLVENKGLPEYHNLYGARRLVETVAVLIGNCPTLNHAPTPGNSIKTDILHKYWLSMKKAKEEYGVALYEGVN